MSAFTAIRDRIWPWCKFRRLRDWSKTLADALEKQTYRAHEAERQNERLRDHIAEATEVLQRGLRDPDLCRDLTEDERAKVFKWAKQ